MLTSNCCALSFISYLFQFSIKFLWRAANWKTRQIDKTLLKLTSLQQTEIKTNMKNIMKRPEISWCFFSCSSPNAEWSERGIKKMFKFVFIVIFKLCCPWFFLFTLVCYAAREHISLINKDFCVFHVACSAFLPDTFRFFLLLHFNFSWNKKNIFNFLEICTPKECDIARGLMLLNMNEIGSKVFAYYF